MRRILRDGVTQLGALEEFVSIQDESSLDLARDYEKSFIWRRWSKLERSALYEAEMSEEFWRSVEELPALNTLILVRPVGLENICICIRTKTYELFLRGRSMRLLLVDIEKEVLQDIPASGWRVTGIGKDVRVLGYSIATSPSSGNAKEICQEWMKSRSVENRLWNL